MLQGALKSIDPFTARGDVIDTTASTRLCGVYLDEEDAGAVIALDLYNPYNYLSETLYRREREALRHELHAPEELFSAAFTVWRLFPDAFIQRYNGLPMAVTGNDRESVPVMSRCCRPPGRRNSHFLAAENTLLFASALVKSHDDEGEGMINTRLTQVAPRLGIVKYQMEL